ncbi:E3 ubiquitin-protein ligase TRIM39-like [Ambystoma mexicanum]|uniref:E3 ubiquitin-protein ligase TRIM39-like n=1 Tax=Ambystoma mexicanum TaxID=8296 RepID=UPI0037E7DF23
MAAAAQLQGLEKETTCSICLENFKEPVSVECGHVFCLPCITKCWDGLETNFPCPQCQETSQNKTLRPYRQLGNMVDLAEEVLVPSPVPEEENVEHVPSPIRQEENVEHVPSPIPQEENVEHVPSPIPQEENMEHAPSPIPQEENMEHAPSPMHQEENMEHVPSPIPQEENMCLEHEQKQKLFCGDDRIPICVVCRESGDHRTHKVRPISEAAQEHKDKLYSYNERLKKELKDLQEWVEEETRKASELKGNIMNQREKIIGTFEYLKQFLEQEKQQLLSRLEKEQEENLMKIQEKLIQLEEQQSTHRDLITELERKCHEQDLELLKDVKSILGRCARVKPLKPKEDGSGTETTLLRARRHAHLREKIAELKETFPAEMEWGYLKSYEREVTLDPCTAHPELIVSEDGRSVRRGEEAQDLPDTPQRFTHHCIVLGSEGLSSGRDFWEVEVGGSTIWFLGVCDESLPRKEMLPLSPEGGFWAVQLMNGKYWARTSPAWTLLSPQAPPRALGFFLDYEAGRFSVYDSQDRSLLFTFSGASFPHALRPFFETWSSEEGLRILPGTGRD